MDNQALVTIDPESSRRDQAPGVEHSQQDAAPFVTWLDQIASDRLPNDGTSTQLHFLIVDRVIGLGLVAAGWLADPRSEVAAIVVNLQDDVTLDLLAEADVLTDRRQILGFSTPKGIAVKCGFVLLVPEQRLSKVSELHLRLHMVTGNTLDRVVPPVGDVLHLGDILGDAPVDYALGIIERLLNASRPGGDRSPRLPKRLGALAGLIHQRIGTGLRQNNVTESGSSTAKCHVDTAIRVGTAGMLVAGWILSDYDDKVDEISLVSLFGGRVVLDTPLPRCSRPDILKLDDGTVGIDCCFAAFAPIDGFGRLDTLWFLQVITADGSIERVPFVCPPEPPPLQGIEATIRLAEMQDSNLSDLFERVISPAAEWFWARTRCPDSNPTETVYGELPSNVRVSVVVPVYGRLDFVRHQIALFSNDPEFCGRHGMIDLIYVLDDPSMADEFSRLCRFLYEVYEVPFRTLVHAKNLGYSAANNAGAAVARGERLLLLNSDVFPTAPRWVGHLEKTYGALEDCGVLGCRLLFADGSIQHAGMSFAASRTIPGCWENEHPGQGLPVSFDCHTRAEPVPAVTGACLMIDRALLQQLGGMSEEYVIGDFEDSDLCLRVHQQGLKVYYTPEVELYHLERQSMQRIGHGNLEWRQSLMLYNMWRHSRRWRTTIPLISASFDTPPAAKNANPPPARNDETIKKRAPRVHTRGEAK